MRSISGLGYSAAKTQDDKDNQDDKKDRHLSIVVHPLDLRYVKTITHPFVHSRNPSRIFSNFST